MAKNIPADGNPRYFFFYKLTYDTVPSFHTPRYKLPFIPVYRAIPAQLGQFYRSTAINELLPNRCVAGVSNIGLLTNISSRTEFRLPTFTAMYCPIHCGIYCRGERHHPPRFVHADNQGNNIAQFIAQYYCLQCECTIMPLTCVDIIYIHGVCLNCRCVQRLKVLHRS